MNPAAPVSNQHIQSAIEKLEKIVVGSGNRQDLEYFHFHHKRFYRMLQSVTAVCAPGQLVLDIGSHYLHSSLLLSFLGYKVHSMDVSEFWELDFVQQRAKEFGLVPITENDLEKLESCRNKKAEYDLVLFTEILEHITFNPINFWQHIYRILRDKGLIYITTPNSITLFNITRTLLHIITLKGVGQDVDSIFRNVTYGHHWKEYSSKEIRAYFRKMSEGFHVSIRKYAYKRFPVRNLKERARAMILTLGDNIPYLRSEIEAIIEVDKSKGWLIEAPVY